MKIAVAGTGYVGLSNAVLLSQKYEVVALDIDKSKVDSINNRISPIKDNELQKVLSTAKLNLRATLSREDAYKNSRFIVIATPTDYNEDTNFFDTSSIESVLRDVEKINPNATCIIRSTIPVGYIKELKLRFNISEIIFCPEFLREGSAFKDSQNPSRIILGSKSNKANEFANILISLSTKKNIETFFMNSDESEAIKLFSNSFLAMRVAFFNELDTFCLNKGLNTKDIILGVASDPRIGNFYNNPSFGYGGYCLPKDTKQLKSNFNGIDNSIISSIIDSNEIRKKNIAQYLVNMNVNDIGIYKLAMKTDSDNFRSSSVLDIAEIIKNTSKINISIYEPAIKENKYRGYKIEKSLNIFKRRSEIILTNRSCSKLSDVSQKIFTRDVFNSD